MVSLTPPKSLHSLVFSSPAPPRAAAAVELPTDRPLGVCSARRVAARQPFPEKKGMNDHDQRGLWAGHLRDEAAEQRVQQESAGASHEPVNGPLPFSADNLDDAVRVERERCAYLAESWASEEKLRQTFADMTEWELRAAAEVARAIARGIRGEPSR